MHVLNGISDFNILDNKLHIHLPTGLSSKLLGEMESYVKVVAFQRNNRELSCEGGNLFILAQEQDSHLLHLYHT